MNQVTSTAGQDRTVHLVVVELHHHSELLRNLIKVLSLRPFRLTLVTLPDVYDKIGLSSDDYGDWVSVQLKKPGETVSAFIHRLHPVFESADLLYFNTIRHFWSELGDIPFVAPSIVRVHNAHCDLAPWSHFDKPVVNALGILSHLIRKVWIGGEWRQKNRLFARIDYFMFPNQAITEYVQDNGWLGKSRILPPVMPFGFLGDRDYGETEAPKSHVTIAVTGKVTNAKKDFHLVYQALRRCLGNLDSPVRLILLGNAGHKHAAKIVEDFKSLESSSFTLDYSEGYVPADVFEQKVADVDFFIAPIEVDTHFRKYHEVYGKSKMSGIENDILLYRKPSLVVSRYKMTAPLDGVVDYFEPTPEALASLITTWVNQRTFQECRARFHQMESYQPEVIAERFYRLCTELTTASGTTQPEH